MPDNMNWEHPLALLVVSTLTGWKSRGELLYCLGMASQATFKVGTQRKLGVHDGPLIKWQNYSFDAQNSFLVPHSHHPPPRGSIMEKWFWSIYDCKLQKLWCCGWIFMSLLFSILLYFQFQTLQVPSFLRLMADPKSIVSIILRGRLGT